MNPHLELPFRALRIGIGLAAFLAGLDKFFNLLADWESYLSPLMRDVVPVSATTFMRTVGVVEMVAGAIVLAGFTRFGGYLVAAWLIGIAVSLVTTGRYFDVAVRDILIALASFTMARLSETREEVTQRVPAVPRLRTE